MNRFALLSLYRSLTRHKLYAGLNVGGLAVGIAVFLVLGLYVRFETSFETWLPGYDHLYLVEENWNQPGAPANGLSSGTMGGLLDILRADLPDTDGTRLFSFGGTIIRNGIGRQEDIAEAEPNFLDVVRLPLIAGDRVTALGDPSSVVLSRTLAEKYFPSGNAMGKTLTLNTRGKTSDYRVSGIFEDLPGATDAELKITAIKQIPRVIDDDYWTHWGSERGLTILRFGSAGQARAYATKLPALVRRRAAKDLGDLLPIYSLRVNPLADLHFQTPGRRLMTATLGLVGLLTLLIALVNYVNLATARAGLRAREVAMRKVLGASRGTLVRQFLGEAILTVALAALLGLIFAELGLPFVNAAGGLSLTMPYAIVAPALVALALVVGVLAGFYPAVLLSRFPAAAVLASSRAPGGGGSGTLIREALVVFQFGLAIAFLIGTAVLFVQTRHVHDADPGFHRDGIVIVSSTSDQAVTDSQRSVFTARLRALADVRAVTVSDSVPGSNNGNSANFTVPGVAGSGPSLQWITVGPGFFALYGIPVIAGRDFDNRHRLDVEEHRKWKEPVNVIINRQAAATLGFASPQAAIGKVINRQEGPRTIVGVVENARFFSPRDAINPTLYYFYPETPLNPKAGILIAGDPHLVMPLIEAIWRQVAPQVPFDAKTARQNLDGYYQADDRASNLFAIGAGLAVLIGCVGLWGLAAFNTSRRVREIGIRKTLGASAADIVTLLVGQFLRPVLIANLVAWPLAYVAMQAWLAGFDDRIALSPLFFIGASLLAIIIAVLTVLGQSLRASRAAPAWALRHD
ncbi:ABC transporter permease [Sphingomonas nostoxanthinifaciens]|uniref:ABC transporter permease n=1 Tax=Sphingomonas nostoxanthinifaciens TaxID=2872652 RepID=UPI001CC21CED|nr:ABC transporter permease [Sphingomonas nostoxanthinifaciens]UAK25481.1 ABC transporter permease [Sphingomonas nostoxanthinifaciens]